MTAYGRIRLPVPGGELAVGVVRTIDGTNHYTILLNARGATAVAGTL